ncbi:MAG: ABC transporter permease subunit [Spirochaetes bacterium]|nr:ABC transporter permease subunit [Spirochaetota bacterium]
MRRNRKILFGGSLLAALCILSLCAPVIAPHDPLRVDIGARFHAPSRIYPLGADGLGRCELSRVLHAAGVSLGASAVTSLAIIVTGILFGMAAALSGGITDRILSRIIDILLSFPSLLLALAVAGMIGPSLAGVAAGIAFTGWAPFARIARNAVLEVMTSEFYQSARVIGAGNGRIMLHYLLPQVMIAVATLAGFELRSVLLGISGLSFLGLGMQAPFPELGAMLGEARIYIGSAPHLIVAPGAMLFFIVLGCTLLGEGLNEYYAVNR